jgi:hypothetical protein
LDRILSAEGMAFAEQKPCADGRDRLNETSSGGVGFVVHFF